ncbi:DUF2141 domain-containing protein [Uliginosibacterium aquaticum]|uniref:DUF2141 domain-containing protein n=1 Tax=Uliginosibacterium aquaticum TaxID=2731212 RepID=A0ABX2IEH5_9RHOO|nr:DUF2141 domain-containing protein [Uliginosibacterium aquaticum]NSL54963.1 DUF2141 domain-containing protein [Uliginosibacterium aquaticum]
MNRLFSVFFLFCALTVQAQTPASGSLEVEVAGVRNASGSLRASLYRPQDAFRKEAQAFRVLVVPAQSGKALLRFEDVPPGSYALMAYHDENASGKLDLRLGMFPLEGYGLSNNPAVFGPPAFADSAFDLPATGSRISVQLKY